MIRYLTKSCAMAVALVMATVVCLPAPVAAGNYYYGGGSSWGGSPSWNDGNQPAPSGEMGRSMGGATGMAIGAVGGAALAAAIAQTAAVAAMGPLATTLVIAGVTGTSLFLGSRLFSTLGQSMERAMGTKNFWTMVGASIGTIAAIALLPTVGIFAGPAGLIMKGVLGGLAGGTLARLFSNQLNFIATPRILFPAVGGLMAAVGGMGFAGAIGGIAVGYIMGSVMDSVYFADRHRSMGQYVDETGHKVTTLGDRLSMWTRNITNWISGKSNDVGHWAGNNWEEDPYYRGYYDSGFTSTYGQSAFAPTPAPAYTYDYTRSYSGPQDVSGAYSGYRDSYQNFIDLNQSGASLAERQRALEDLRHSSQTYSNTRQGSFGGFDYGNFNYGY